MNYVKAFYFFFSKISVQLESMDFLNTNGIMDHQSHSELVDTTVLE